MGFRCVLSEYVISLVSLVLFLFKIAYHTFSFSLPITPSFSLARASFTHQQIFPNVKHVLYIFMYASTKAIPETLKRKDCLDAGS